MPFFPLARVELGAHMIDIVEIHIIRYKNGKLYSR